MNKELIKQLKAQKLAYLVKNHETILYNDLNKPLAINQQLALALQLTITLGMRLGSEGSEGVGASTFKLEHYDKIRFNDSLNCYEVDVSFVTKMNRVFIYFF